MSFTPPKGLVLFPEVEGTSASRRVFLQRAGALSTLGAAAPWALSLSAMADAAAAGATDYKALVCVFLYGGNDYANTLVPFDLASYNAQNLYRSNMAISRAALSPNLLTPTLALPDSRQYALAPGLEPLVPLFHSGAMSVLLNIGTLVQPTSKLQYTNRTVALPPKLFSHNDQQSYWQSSYSEGALSGWGGRMGDLFASSNGNATFTSISVTGNATFLSGQVARQYQVSTSGSVPVAAIRSPLFGSSACSAALSGLMTSPRPHLLENEVAW